MKITKVRTYPLFAPIKEPYWTAQESNNGVHAIITEIETDEGIVGYSKVQGTPQKDICGADKRTGSSPVDNYLGILIRIILPTAACSVSG